MPFGQQFVHAANAGAAQPHRSLYAVNISGKREPRLLGFPPTLGNKTLERISRGELVLAWGTSPADAIEAARTLTDTRPSSSLLDLTRLSGLRQPGWWWYEATPRPRSAEKFGKHGVWFIHRPGQTDAPVPQQVFLATAQILQDLARTSPYPFRVHGKLAEEPLVIHDIPRIRFMFYASAEETVGGRAERAALLVAFLQAREILTRKHPQFAPLFEENRHGRTLTWKITWKTDAQTDEEWTSGTHAVFQRLRLR